jgi:hypothetical protein
VYSSVPITDIHNVTSCTPVLRTPHVSDPLYSVPLRRRHLVTALQYFQNYEKQHKPSGDQFGHLNFSALCR